MKRFRALALALAAVLFLGLGSCTRNIFTETIPTTVNVWVGDMNEAYDMFSKYFLNVDFDDPYLD